MRKKIIVAPVALVASLALVFGSAMADETETDAPEDCTVVENVNDVESLDAVHDAADDASDAAEDLEDGDACPDLENGHETAVVAWQAALDRLSVEGAGGNGVAAAVLTALINGESPSGIGAAHGTEMAQAAADRRAERDADENTSDDSDESDDVDGSGKPDSAGQNGSHGRP